MIKTTTTIKDINGNEVEVEKCEIYETLSKMLGLREVGPNFWSDDNKNCWILTAYGFKRMETAR